MEIRTQYDRDRKFAIEFKDESLTHQSMAEETDINNIMRRFEKTRIVEHLNKHQGKYGDFFDVPNYHFALNQIRAAEASFMELPAAIRRRFDNDPAAFLEFVQDPQNASELVDMGLAKAPPPAPEEPLAAVVPEEPLTTAATSPEPSTGS